MSWTPKEKQPDELTERKVPELRTKPGPAAEEVGKPLLYLNSLDSVSLAINQRNFAERYGIRSGPEWSLQIRR